MYREEEKLVPHKNYYPGENNILFKHCLQSPTIVHSRFFLSFKKKVLYTSASLVRFFSVFQNLNIILQLVQHTFFSCSTNELCCLRNLQRVIRKTKHSRKNKSFFFKKAQGEKKNCGYYKVYKLHLCSSRSFLFLLRLLLIRGEGPYRKAVTIHRFDWLKYCAFIRIKKK